MKPETKIENNLIGIPIPLQRGNLLHLPFSMKSIPAAPLPHRICKEAKTIVKAIGIAIALLIFQQTPAHADIGVPMILFFWPTSWIALLAIIPLEAAVAYRVAGIDIKQSLKISACANLFSTVIGIPVTWLTLTVIQLVSGGGGALGLDTAKQKVYAVTVQAPWLIPYDTDLYWMIPTAAITLCLPFCLMSVASESVIARRWMPKATASKWSWIANLLSYGIMIIVFAVMLICAIRDHH